MTVAMINLVALALLNLFSFAQQVHDGFPIALISFLRQLLLDFLLGEPSVLGAFCGRRRLSRQEVSSEEVGLRPVNSKREVSVCAPRSTLC